MILEIVKCPMKKKNRKRYNCLIVLPYGTKTFLYAVVFFSLAFHLIILRLYSTDLFRNGYFSSFSAKIQFITSLQWLTCVLICQLRKPSIKKRYKIFLKCFIQLATGTHSLKTGREISRSKVVCSLRQLVVNLS